MSMSTLIKKHIIGAGLQFRGLDHYHDRKHGGMQVDMVLERQLRVLRLDQQTAERENDTGLGLSI